jgi:drug/metabolite transporter (DMT)-like permease
VHFSIHERLPLDPERDSRLPQVAAGIACGVGAALCWAAGFVGARHGLDVGFTPPDLTIHRYAWAGFALLPLVLRNGIGNLNGIGWGRGIVLTLLGGPGFALLSYTGLTLVPLGHGGVIQPSCATLGGVLLAVLLLCERLGAVRATGAAIIVCGLVVIGGESVASIGAYGIAGDLTFVAAGLMFGLFGILLRLWSVEANKASAVISVLTLAGVPFYWALGGFDRLIALGLWENLLQAFVQGILAGPAALYLFIRSIRALGAARGSVFPALVPPSVLLVGWLALGEPPSALQVAGLAIVLVGFRLVQKS